MIPNAYKEFIKEVIDLSEGGKIKWIKKEDNEFYFINDDVKITVSFYSDLGAELSYYYLNYFSRKESTQDGFRVSNYENDYYLMEQLFGSASRSAQNINVKLNNLLGNIKANPSGNIIKKLTPGSAKIITLKDGKKINAGVIRVEPGDFLVFYTGKGLREMFKPNMTKEENENANKLKELNDDELIKGNYIDKIKLSEITNVEP